MIKHEKKSLTSSEVLRLINESSKDGFDHNHLMGFIISQRIRTFIDFSGALFESDFVGGRERGSDSIVKPHGRQQVVNSFDLRIIHTYQTDTDMSEFLVAGIYSNKPLLLRGAFYHREEQKWDSALSVGDWGLSDKGFIKVFADSAGPMLKFDEMEIKTLWPKKVSGNPSTEVLQSENQHLHQEMEALKAEVEQLRAENAELKAVGERQEKTDDPRQIKNMAKAIYGMAINKYQYNPELQRNTATSVIQRALEKQGIQLDRDTIKRYIDTGKSAFEEDGK